MAKKLLLPFIFLSCCYSNYLGAQAIAGGEIYYELTGPKKYKITAYIYRMCEYPALNSISGAVFGSTYSAVVTYTRTAIQKISDTCGNPCKIQNTTSTAGFERHTYEATVDFNTGIYKTFVTNNVCNVNFAVKMSGRIGVSTHATGLFYLDAGVNLCDTTVKKNHSPVFSMEPKFLAYCNQPVKYSPGPLDSTDYDSLSFEMAPVQVDYNKSIIYTPNYSGSIPLSPYCPPNSTITNCNPIPTAKQPRGFYFDKNLCQIVFMPPKCAEKAYVKMRINEYRKNPVSGQMVLIGFVTREMLMQVKPVPGNNVVDFSVDPTIYSVCNDELKTIKTIDDVALPIQLKPDVTSIFWDHGYDRVKFQVVDTSRLKSADITLLKDSSLTKARQRFFTVGAFDQRCNISLQTLSFQVRDYPLPKYKLVKNMYTCNIWKYNITNPDSTHSNDVKTNMSISDPASKTIFTSANNSDSFTFNKNGRHIIQYNVANSPFVCYATFYDTIYISNAFLQGIINSGNDTVVCKPYASRLSFHPYISKGLTKIEWYRNDTLFNTKDSVINQTVTKDVTYKLKLTDNKGCKAESHLIYTIKQHNALLDFTLTQCSHTPASFTAIINTLKTPVTYKWNINGKDTSVTNRTLSFMLKDSTLVRLTLKDSNNCVFTDSVTALIKPTFSFQMKQDKKEICTNDSMTITAFGITAISPYKLIWRTSKTDSLLEDTILKRKFTNKKTVLLSITDAATCTRFDSLVITPLIIPKAILPAFPALCEGDQVNITPNYIPNITPKTYLWKLNDTIVPITDSFYVFRVRRASKVYLKTSNKLGCYSEDSTSMKMNPRPVFNIISNINYHHAHKISLNTDKAFISYHWFNNVYTQANTFWAYELGAPGKHTIWCDVTDNKGCNGGDTIDIFTDKLVSLPTLQDENLRIYPNPGQHEFFVEAEGDCLLTLINVEGKTVLEQSLLTGKNTINTGTLPSGFYMVRIGNRHMMWMKE